MPDYGGLLLHSIESKINYYFREPLTYLLTATVLNEDKVDYPEQSIPKAGVLSLAYNVFL